MLKTVMSRLFVEFFSLTVPEDFLEEPFCVSQILWQRKYLWIVDGGVEGGSNTTSCQNFCLTVPKYFVEKPFSVSLTLSIEKYYDEDGYVTIFCRIVLSHSTEKIRRGTLMFSVSENFRQQKSFWIRMGGKCQDFPSKNFYITLPKDFIEEYFSVSII